MRSTKTAIMWFRQDLRIYDNPALIKAVASGQVLPIYILDDVNSEHWSMGAASRVWLHGSLKALDKSLKGHLNLFVGDATAIIEKLVTLHNIDAVYWNRCYEPWRIKRDSTIKAQLEIREIESQTFNGSLLWEPWTVLKKDDTPYKVFTPFYRNGCLNKPDPRTPFDSPREIDYFFDKNLSSSDLTLEALNLLGKQCWPIKIQQTWRMGELAAQQQLDSFCEDALSQYQKGRDFPSLQATSKLSPHLHFGEISPHQLWHRMTLEKARVISNDPDHFLREIAWREFSYYQLYHFPQLPDEVFNPKFKHFKWREDSESFSLWTKGQTGFPIIDAGMRELWETGTMHNRVRMVVASFLIKNQLLHWHKGERWFWDCLVDADLASNSASWQWCAGSGADAAPYFRIFNPVLQSQKFDPQGNYLIRYCPELASLPPKLRHAPWLAKPEALDLANIKLGVDYPLPILDLKTTRQRALDSFKALPKPDAGL
jgi:deoxyribodipyrimidine photo-lyase